MKKTGKDKICGSCGQSFYVPKCRLHVAKFCSKQCYDAAQTGDRKETKCVKCGEKFLAKKDHGVWQKYCSRECFKNPETRPRWKECPICNSMFFAKRTGHGQTAIYCSMKCRSTAMLRQNERTCVNCGSFFYLSDAQVKQRPDESCCSMECRDEFYVKDNNPNWKGGKYKSEVNGHVYVLQERPGYVGKYPAEHRIVAAKAIGRMLDRSEYILHINNDRSDNKPENLFICGTLSECSRRRFGSLPWPKKSNLGEYK